MKKDANEYSTLLKENERLKHAIKELSILYDISSAIDATSSLKSIINYIVSKCVKHFDVEQCAVLLLDKLDKNDNFKTVLRKADESKMFSPLRLDSQLAGWMIKNKKNIRINNLMNDERFLYDKTNSDIKSLICSPLINKGDLIGLITIFNKKNGALFSQDDEKLLSIVASQSARVLENARLYEEEQLLFSLQEEMRLAKQIQLNLLPQKPPKVNGYEISAISIPAKVVGGDYYDFIQISDTQTAFCLGDITGKGLPAAMLMANLQATLRGQALYAKNPEECISKSNKLLFESTEPDRFATIFYGIIDTDLDEIFICNAGHDRPILSDKFGKTHLIEKAGLLLGALPKYISDTDSIKMKSGDVLVLYTDGITEAMNQEEEEFSLSRLIEVIEENIDLRPKAIQDCIINSVNNHSINTEQSDDITLMIIKKN